MNLPPSKIGDKGQRYTVETLNWPNEGWCKFGYAGTREGAKEMGEAMMLHPCVDKYRIIDRALL